MLNLVAATSFYALSVFCHPAFSDNQHAINSCAVIVSKKSPHATKEECEIDLKDGVERFKAGGYTRMLEDPNSAINFVCEESVDEPSNEDMVEKYGIGDRT